MSKTVPPAGSYVVDTKWCRASRTFISVVNLQHEDNEWIVEDAEGKWGAVCLEHDQCQPCSTRRVAHVIAARPQEWCPGCKRA